MCATPHLSRSTSTGLRRPAGRTSPSVRARQALAFFCRSEAEGPSDATRTKTAVSNERDRAASRTIHPPGSRASGYVLLSQPWLVVPPFSPAGDGRRGVGGSVDLAGSAE